MHTAQPDLELNLLGRPLLGCLQHLVNTHLSALDLQTAKTSTFQEVVTLTGDQLNKGICSTCLFFTLFIPMGTVNVDFLFHTPVESLVITISIYYHIVAW